MNRNHHVPVSAVRLSRLIVAVTIALLLSPTVLRADITSHGGAVQVLGSPPATVVGGAFESNTAIHVFRERTMMLLVADARLSISAPGVYNDANPDNTPYTVPKGTRVNSYYAHFDKVGGNGTFVAVDGSVTFSEAIIGVIIESGLLNSTHGLFGAASTKYPTDSSQGIELRNDPNVISLSADRHTLTMHLAVTCCSDTLRIITGDIADAPGKADSDGDGTIDSLDGCPQDPNKQSPGNCGCGVRESNCSPAGQVLNGNFCGIGGASFSLLPVMMIACRIRFRDRGRRFSNWRE